MEDSFSGQSALEGTTCNDGRGPLKMASAAMTRPMRCVVWSRRSRGRSRNASCGDCERLLYAALRYLNFVQSNLFGRGISPELPCNSYVVSTLEFKQPICCVARFVNGSCDFLVM